MKFIEHSINKDNNFIMGWYAQDTSFCDEIVDFWKSSDNKNAGVVGTSENPNIVDKSIKDSLDVSLNLESLSKLKYAKVLKQCADNYTNTYTESMAGGYKLYNYIPIQYYPIGGGYKEWHCERHTADYPAVARHLVFMTYLNDVEDGGTEFYYQDLRVKAEKGLTIIWPADWTFTHKGQVSHTSEKYIITGWFELMRAGELSSYLKKDHK